MNPPSKPAHPSNGDQTRHKAIKSYVLRSGRMTAGQRRALNELWPDYGLARQIGLYDFATLFECDAPCVLEIGFGNGENLVSMAAAEPGTNFIGIEVHEPGVGHCLLKAEQSGVKNLKVARQDAVDILKENIPDSSLARVNLFFPDPWHKKRHHKRRIVQPDFVALLAKKLAANGVFHVVTDWPDYAEQIEAVMSADTNFEPLDAAPKDRVTTRFDSRGARLGHRNWERAWCRRSKLNSGRK